MSLPVKRSSIIRLVRAISLAYLLARGRQSAFGRQSRTAPASAPTALGIHPAAQQTVSGGDIHHSSSTSFCRRQDTFLGNPRGRFVRNISSFPLSAHSFDFFLSFVSAFSLSPLTLLFPFFNRAETLLPHGVMASLPQLLPRARQSIS